MERLVIFASCLSYSCSGLLRVGPDLSGPDQDYMNETWVLLETCSWSYTLRYSRDLLVCCAAPQAIEAPICHPKAG
ncbi:uncharacterized protein BCR38DRAFT_440401 [Pseudomassariella vexata]|uniref:Uncharacterized protein n=1 Tax=Pseudomassariella vexata TaxID=1141098 RepID=A0A1Y2DQD1_9PEZI|nr:uncharacterized protein BCR38DRAFT_440401 [Pseudomassariella vexata]ORY61498.1 hypothetical protein BCR38DRAFT_440401 [Pseudomassariella vexata]